MIPEALPKSKRVKELSVVEFSNKFDTVEACEKYLIKCQIEMPHHLRAAYIKILKSHLLFSLADEYFGVIADELIAAKLEPKDSSELTEAWEGFIQMRKEIKKPVTERGIKLLKKKVLELSGGNEQKAIQILDQSSLNNWQDVYELKIGFNSKQLNGREDKQVPKVGRIDRDKLSNYANRRGTGNEYPQ